MPMPTIREAVTCAHLACDRPEHARGLCRAHYARVVAGLSIAPPVGPRGRPRTQEALTEDVEWLLADQPAVETAARVGRSTTATRRALYRAKRPDLARRFPKAA